MLGQTWFYDLIKKQLIMFGSLFTEIYINRTDANNVVIQSILVPIRYGPKEKFLARIEEDPNLARPATVLPMISFQLDNLVYDPDRKLNTLNKNYVSGPNGTLNSAYGPVPYNFDIELSVMVKNIADGNQVVEQILPMFPPEWIMTVNLMPQLSQQLNIPIVLKSSTPTDTYASDFKTRRFLFWTFKFTIKGYLWGPVISQGPIRTVIVNLWDTTSQGNTKLETITVTPGLTANGEPTSNASLSIPINQIPANSNYGFVKDITTYDDQ